MSLPPTLQLSPALAAAIERLGWSADQPLLKEAAPTAARGHNLVVVAPPAPVYGGPMLAGLLSRTGDGRRTLLLGSSAHLLEWSKVAHELTRDSGLRVEAAQGEARASRRLRAGEVDLLIASPELALSLHRRSALDAERIGAVVLAWPEGWEEGEALTSLMADLPKDAQRVVLTGAPDRSAGLVERYVRRPLTVGGDPAGSPRPAPGGPVRVTSVSWERRAPAVAELLELLDPATAAVWTADRTHHGAIAQAIGAGAGGVTITTGDPARTALVVAFDPPSSERLASLLAAGDVVLLVPPGAETYVERIAAPRRPLRLSGLLDRVTSASAARRGLVARTLEGGAPEPALAALAPLFERYDATAVAAALYQLWTSSGAAASEPVPEPTGTAKIFVGIGKKDGATVNDLVAVLTKEVRLDRTQVGRVELKDAYMLVEIPAREAERVAGALNGVTIRRKRVTARVDRGPVRAARPARSVRPAGRG